MRCNATLCSAPQHNALCCNSRLYLVASAIVLCCWGAALPQLAAAAMPEGLFCSPPCFGCRHEEELSDALRNGQLNSETGVSDWLCLTTARHCTVTRAAEEAAAVKATAAQQAAADAAAAADKADEAGGGEKGAGRGAGTKLPDTAAPNAEL
jgi:hypothetical protein